MSSNLTANRNASSANDISNIIKKIRLNDYNRDKRDYLKRKNKEYQKLGSNNLLRGAFDRSDPNLQDLGGSKLDKRMKKTLKDKALEKKGEEYGSTRKAGKKGSKTKGNKMSEEDIE